MEINVDVFLRVRDGIEEWPCLSVAAAFPEEGRFSRCSLDVHTTRTCRVFGRRE